ncbi:hypothetical protein AT705_03900 [Pseudoalteromonas rubra]|uniref:Uncharacterized protein n=1 Tax=Pseudoalteromonas rubra TaxID=43658 RepID=A0A0U3GBI4_9GAMM|nr:hypothetical protein AT705_03900 [Pseudoalteromonas rubra]
MHCHLLLWFFPASVVQKHLSSERNHILLDDNSSGFWFFKISFLMGILDYLGFDSAVAGDWLMQSENADHARLDNASYRS